VSEPRAGLQAPGDRLQQAVADCVTQGVVDRLEAVQVDKQDGEHLLVALRLRDRLPDAVVQQ